MGRCLLKIGGIQHCQAGASADSASKHACNRAVCTSVCVIRVEDCVSVRECHVPKDCWCKVVPACPGGGDVLRIRVRKTLPLHPFCVIMVMSRAHNCLSSMVASSGWRALLGLCARFH